MPSKKKIASFVVSLFITIAPMISLADGPLKQIVPDSCNKQPGGCQSICDIAKLAQNVLNDSIFFAIVLSAIVFAATGWVYMTAGGEPYKIKAAKKMFGNLLIGLTIMVGAWLFVDTIISTLTGTSGLQWNRIC